MSRPTTRCTRLRWGSACVDVVGVGGQGWLRFRFWQVGAFDAAAHPAPPPMRAIPYRLQRSGRKRVWHDLRFKDLYRSGKEFELMGRAMGFAALAMLTMFPLLVVVANAGAASRHGLARWVVYGMGLNGS